MKKLLILAVLIVMAFSVTAYAREKVELYIEPIEVTEFVLSDFVTMEQMPQTLSVNKDYETMYNGIKNCDGIIEFAIEATLDTYQSVANQYGQELGNIYFNVLYENPELMQAATSYSIPVDAYYNDDYTKIIIEMHFKPRYVLEPSGNVTAEERDAYLKRELPPLVKKALLHADSVVADAIKEYMTEEEKALILHDFVLDHIHYNTEYASTVRQPSTNEHWQNHTAFGVFNNHTAVCQGYALAYNLLLTRAGIPNKYVSGVANGGGHAWSVIKLGDDWYHVDATHDDPSNIDCIDHGHFLLSDAKIYSLGHTYWETDVQCTSEKYDGVNYCFHDIDASEETIHYNNGFFYAYRHLHVDVTFNANDRPIKIELLPEYNYEKQYRNYYQMDRDKDGVADVYFVYEYVKSNFDGSEFEIIDEDEYKKSFIKDENPEINSLYVDQNGKAHDLTLENVSKGRIYVRMIDETEPCIYVAFYNDNKLIKMAKPEMLYEHAVEISTVVPEEEYSKVVVFAWGNDGLRPITENLIIE